MQIDIGIKEQDLKRLADELSKLLSDSYTLYLKTHGHETVVRTARKVLRIASEAGDDATADLATQRLQVHEKTAWMLRSLLEN